MVSFSFANAKNSHGMTKQEWIKITGVFVIWRIGLFVIGSIAQQLIPYQPSFPYTNLILATYNLPQWLYSWANFDGVHYITIVSLGYYGIGLVQAFFPFYPMIVNGLNYLFANPIISGLLVSNGFFYLFLLVWYSFVAYKYNRHLAWKTLLVIISFPTAFFFGAMYTESLFLFLVVSSFYAAEKHRWSIAIGCAILASATRLVGIFLIPALFVELLRQQYHQYMLQLRKIGHHFSKKAIVDFLRIFWKWQFAGQILAITLGGLGLVLYMMYLWLTFDDPLYFYHVQSQFNVGRSETVIFYPQVVWRYVKILATYRPLGFHYFSYIQELLVATVGFGVLILSAEYVVLSAVLFSLLALALPTLTGTFASLPRYVLVCVPIYVYLAKWGEKHPHWFKLYLSVSTILLILNTILFIQGYWVA